MSAIYSHTFFYSNLICFRILCDLQHSRDESNRWFYARLCNNERLSYQISLPWSIQMYAFCFKDFLYQFHRKLRNIFWLACWLMILCFNVGKWEAFISLTIGEIYTLKSWLVTKLSYNIWNFDVSAYAVFGGIEVLWKERKSRFKKYIYTHPTPINKILHRHSIFSLKF